MIVAEGLTRFLRIRWDECNTLTIDNFQNRNGIECWVEVAYVNMGRKGHCDFDFAVWMDIHNRLQELDRKLAADIERARA